jgi:hypothetical protein
MFMGGVANRYYPVGTSAHDCFGEDMVMILNDIRRIAVLNAVAKDLMSLCEQYGWENQATIIADYLVESKGLTDLFDPTDVFWNHLRVRPDKTAPLLTYSKGSTPTETLEFLPNIQVIFNC